MTGAHSQFNAEISSFLLKICYIYVGVCDHSPEVLKGSGRRSEILARTEATWSDVKKIVVESKVMK